MNKYFVRTTLERKLDSSYSQIDYELLVDTNHEPVNSFIEQLEFISDYDSVLLEDDLLLCNDFKNKIEEVIEKYPNDIINFFTKPHAFFTTNYSQCFSYNQCTYYPKGIGKVLANEIRNQLKLNPKFQYDQLENMAMQKLKILNVCYRPCLVQHLDYSSLIQQRGLSRWTPYFIDYLKELHIDYMDAYSNKDKLIKLMKEKLNI